MPHQPPQMLQQQQPQAHNNNNVNITPVSVNVNLPPQATGGMSPESANQYAETMSDQNPVVVEYITENPDYLKYGIITGIVIISVIVCIYIYSEFATPDPRYMHATSVLDQTVPVGTTSSAPYAVKFPDVLSSAGITATSPSVFLLPVGATYVLRGVLTWAKGNTIFRWANVTKGKLVFIGKEGSVESKVYSHGGTSRAFNAAEVNISADVPTSVSLYVLSGDDYLIRGQNSEIDRRGPLISIESLDKNTHIPTTTTN